MYSQEPGLPGCWSQGATRAEAAETIEAAMREYLAVRQAVAFGSGDADAGRVVSHDEVMRRLGLQGIPPDAHAARPMVLPVYDTAPSWHLLAASGLPYSGRRDLTCAAGAGRSPASGARPRLGRSSTRDPLSPLGGR